ncbi:MAG: sialidase family protein [Acidobacteria bacterium]|nr:sialidase family protein [Acidobacteriota bacterium]
MRLLALSLLLATLSPAAGPRVLKTVTVYGHPGRYGGWPANHGIWVCGNEIVAGFSAGYMMSNGPDRHAIDYNRPEEFLLARSLDGGSTWTIEDPSSKGFLVGEVSGHNRGYNTHRKGLRPPGLVDEKVIACPGVDFSAPDSAVTIRMQNVDAGPSYWWYSPDRAHTWQGPFALPLFGRPGIAARTDYLVDGSGRALFFMTAAKPTKKEGRPFSASTEDGGRTWKFGGWMGPEPPDREFAIMPSTVRPASGNLLSTVRYSASDEKNWIDAYTSADNGVTWKLLNRPVADTGGHHGSPPHLIHLRDGRLCLTYGYRSAPYGIRARLSSDDGITWSQELVLRDDAASWDVGYPRTVQRADGKIVTVYYAHEKGGSERKVSATIWDPGSR